MKPLTRAQHHDLYYYLRLNRRVDEQLVNLYRQGKVVGGVYSSLGQEAISVGTAYALAPQDVIGPMIRNVGAMLVRGFRPRDVFLQYMARRDGPTGGRDANTHCGDMARGIIAPNSMLGEPVSVLAGVALAAKLRKEKRVALTYVGDGATSTGAFHEGANFAAVQKLPLILIAENNAWAYSTPIAKQMAVRDLAERARRGGGPAFIECKTMRMKGHAEHDDASYVPKGTLDKWRKKDPILRYEKYLCKKKLMTAEENSGLEARVEKEIRDDVAFAEASPFPAPEEAARSVWA